MQGSTPGLECVNDISQAHIHINSLWGSLPDMTLLTGVRRSETMSALTATGTNEP